MDAGMLNFLEALLNGLVFGAIYALMSLSFVVVYKTTRVANFALGEFIMTGAALVAAGVHVLLLGWAGALLFACAGMLLLAWILNWLVIRRVKRGDLIVLLMVTLGLGAFLQGFGAVVLRGFPRTIPFPLPQGTVEVAGMLFSLDEWSAGGIAVACIAALSVFFLKSRAGLALRVLAEGRHIAEAMGISAARYNTLAWGLAGAVAVIAGTLWSALTGGGVGLVFLGLKVFPIVIIGGLDSLPGTVVGGILVGVLESLAATYLDPPLGGGFSHILSYLVVIAALMIRPHGLFGRPSIERV